MQAAGRSNPVDAWFDWVDNSCLDIHISSLSNVESFDMLKKEIKGKRVDFTEMREKPRRSGRGGIVLPR
jgi:hypothetical protein